MEFIHCVRGPCIRESACKEGWDMIAARIASTLAFFSVLAPISGQETKGVAEPDLTAIREQAAAGDAHAQFRLGFAYNLGVSINQEDNTKTEGAKLAAHWYRKSAEQGHLGGQVMLGSVLAEGFGV